MLNCEKGRCQVFLLFAPSLWILDQELLKLLLEKVVEKFGHPQPEDWQDGIFILLSEEIEKETRFLISRNTLKRLFGKIKTAEGYSPQLDTRNALAIYAGFGDWNQFKIMALSENKEKFLIPEATKSRERKSSFSRLQISMLFLALLLISALFGFWLWPKPEADWSQIKIHIENPVDTAPFTLVVNYEIPKDFEDSVFLGVGGTSFLLPKDKKIFVHSLHRPIYSFVYLKNRKKQIRAIPIKAYSRDLEAFYENGTQLLHIPRNQFLDKGFAGLKKDFFATNRLDSSDFYSSFIKVKDYDIDADQFSFETRFRVEKSTKLCQYFQVKIFADSGHHELEIHNRGCAQSNFVAPAELFFGGKFENLTTLSPKESGNWRTLKIESKNKEFFLFLDGKKVFSARYKKTMGRMSVLKMQFNGFGQIDFYRIRNEKSELVEAEEF